MNTQNCALPPRSWEKSTAGLGVVEMFFVGAAAIVADLVIPAARQQLLLLLFLLTCLLARLLSVALFVGAPSRVFVDQDSFD